MTHTCAFVAFVSGYIAVLEKVREVSRNAYSLAGRVQNLISALTESVRHVCE